MTRVPYEPLSTEERELAQRLAQLGAHGEPSAALDAQILSAAHAALSRKPSRSTRRPRRWPVALGAVATLALAVGVAWQLRPRPESAQVYSEAPAPVRARQSGPSAAEELPTADLSAADAPESDAAQAMEPPPPPPAPAAIAPAAKAEPAATANSPAAAEEAQAFPQVSEGREARPPTEAAPAPAPVPPRADIVFDQGAAAEAEAASPAPAPGTSTDASAGAARVQRNITGEAKQARQASDALDQIIVTGTRIEGADEEKAAREEARDNAGYSDQEIDDQPPATADSPLVQKAWLQRIRELIANGKLDEARSSLAEFKRRYPRYALPDDLHGLLP